MIDKGKIGTLEAFSLACIMIGAKIFYTSPGVILQKTATASWYVTIISCITTMISFYFFCVLMERFPNKNIFKIFEIVLGRFLGKIFNFLFSFFAIFYCGSNLREFVEMIKTYIIPYTSTSFIMLTILFVAVLFSYLGLETIARVSVIGLFFVFAGLAAILLLGISNYEPAFLAPYLGYGIKKNLMYGALRSSAYFEFSILPSLMLFIPDIKTFKKAGYTAILTSGAVFSISLICYIMTFGYVQGKDNMAGLFELSRAIYINRFIERVESIFLFSWVISSVITVGISFYIAVYIYCTVFNIKNHRPLFLYFVFLAFIVAILPKNISEVVDINMIFLKQYTVFFIHTVPFLLLPIAMIRKKKGETLCIKKQP